MNNSKKLILIIIFIILIGISGLFIFIYFQLIPMIYDGYWADRDFCKDFYLTHSGVCDDFRSDFDFFLVFVFSPLLLYILIIIIIFIKIYTKEISKENKEVNKE